MADLNVWVVMPTVQKDHVPGILNKWNERGYKIGLFVDPGPIRQDMPVRMLMVAPYPSVWRSWNALAKAVFAQGADVCAMIGDDMEPDPNKTAQEIGREYLERFPTGLGVMQPCGDPQGMDRDTNSASKESVPAAARICGSPWVGREWVHRAYRGDGPVNGRYWAFYADEEMKLVSERMGLLWMRPDLTQFHKHWSWQHLPKQPYHERNQKQWENDKRIFDEAKAAGFPEAVLL